MTRYTWRAHEIERQTPDSVTIHFDTGENGFEYKAGQFINLDIAVDGRTICRSYSLCSAPELNERPAITVKAIEGGLASNHIVSFADRISSWDVTGAFGNFSPKAATTEAEDVVLIAGGSGITPLWSIAKSLLRRTASRVYIIYACRNEEDALFKDAMEAYQASFGERLFVKHVYSRKQVSASGGRLSYDSLKALLTGTLAEGASAAHYFLCGPAGLMQMASEVLKSIDIPEEAVHCEHFFEADVPTVERLTELPSLEVLLHAGDRSSLIDVKPDETILDAALKENIPLYYSCKSGSCGVCVAKLLSGSVQMTKNSALDDNQIAEGYILLCQSHPTDDNVAIEADADWKDVLEISLNG